MPPLLRLDGARECCLEIIPREAKDESRRKKEEFSQNDGVRSPAGCVSRNSVAGTASP